MATAIQPPPLGITPRFIWLSKRVKHIDDAITRYMEVGKEIPKEWVEERNDILRELSKIDECKALEEWV